MASRSCLILDIVSSLAALCGLYAAPRKAVVMTTSVDKCSINCCIRCSSSSKDSMSLLAVGINVEFVSKIPCKTWMCPSSPGMDETTLHVVSSTGGACVYLFHASEYPGTLTPQDLSSSEKHATSTSALASMYNSP